MKTLTKLAAVLGLCCLPGFALAQNASAIYSPDALKPQGQSQIVRLWPGTQPATCPVDEGEQISVRGDAKNPSLVLSNIRQANLGVFLPSGNGPFPAVVICPGGGYRQESMTSEGYAVAQKLAKAGMAAFVLKYRLPDGHLPAEGKLPLPQQDVFRAIQLVRTNAAEWKLDPKRIGVMGFSAGGHLAATAATLFDLAENETPKDEISKQSARPDFAVLVYPVISMTKPMAHAGSRDRLLGKDADATAEARFDPSQHVTSQTPPLLLVHAVDDQVVMPANSMRMLAAAEKANVPHSMLLLSHGKHGFGLGNDAEAQGWSDQCLAWLRGQGILH